MKNLIALIIIFFSSWSYAQSDSPTIAVFHLDRLFSEGHHEPGLEELINPETEPKTFMSLISRLRRAAQDDKVKACLFFGDFTGLGLAQSAELSRHIKKISDSGKETVFFAHNISNFNIIAASAVTKTVLFPDGEAMLNGIYFQNMYFKGLLDKLGLQADVIHIGDYKSAGEPFYLTEPSQESKIQSKKLYDGIYANSTNLIATNWKRDAKSVHSLTDKAIFSAQEALDHNIVDQLAYQKDIIDQLKKKYPSATFTAKYAVPSQPQLKMNSIMDLFALIQQLSAPPKVDTMDKVSLTVLEGNIDKKMGETFRRHILKQAKNKRVKAMILRVNSPGGSALASEVICQALIEFKSTGKPLIVSMSNVAASGGYYVAAPADTIYAENSTITGSIGVVGGKLVFGQLLEKIGITTHGYSKGKHADLMSITNKFSPSQKALIKKSFVRVYDTFKKRVTEGRKGKLKGNIEDIAGGRVYTGSQALEIGLIDKIGGLREAINEGVKSSKLKQYKIAMFPKKVTIMDLLSKELRNESDDAFIKSAKPKSIDNMLLQANLKTQLKTLAKLNPLLAKQITSFVQQLQLFADEGVLLVAPQFPY